MGRVRLRGRPACPPPFPVLACGVGVCAGPGSRLCPALLGWVVGVCFLRYFFFAGCPCPGPCGPCPPIPFLSGWVAGSFFFPGLCLLVSVSLFLVGRCFWLRVAGFGWVVPLCLFGGPVFGAFWGGFGRLWCCWRAVWWLWVVFAPPPLPPLLFCFVFVFFLAGGCLFLPLPSLGWRTHWPAFSVVFQAAVVSCVLFGRVPAPWVGLGYVHGGLSAPSCRVGWSLTDYQSEYEEILQALSTGLEPRVIDGHQWYKNNQYLFYEDRIAVPEARLDGCLQWSHLSSGHTGANRSVDFFRECFYSSLTLTELRLRMQTIVDASGFHAREQSDSRDRGLISSLPIPYCANSLLYVDFIHGLPRFGGYDSCLVVTCGLSCFTRVFPCNKEITGEQTVKMLVEQWFEPYGGR